MQQLPTFTPRTRELLQYNPLQYMFNALAETPGLAHIYVDRAPLANTVIVFWKRSIFIGGRFSAESLSFLSEEILNQEVRSCLHVFYISYPDIVWLEAIKKRFDANFSLGERSLFLQ